MSASEVERDFRIFEELREDESAKPTSQLKEGQILHPGLDPGPCTKHCSFTRLSRKRTRANVYVCKTHARVHHCGNKCCQKVMSHEDWSCPWTGEVIEQSLFGEEPGSNQNRTRNNSVSQASYQGGDATSDKYRRQSIRNSDALVEVCDVCSEAILQSGWTSDSFLDALLEFFHLLVEKTKLFEDHEIITRKTVLQFGFACAYMHRRGYNLGDKVLFERLDSFNTHLPRTHALLDKGYKIRAITKQQELIKSYLKSAIDSGANGSWAFPAPQG